jgi:hypothetical protein
MADVADLATRGALGSVRGFRGSDVANWNVVRERLPRPVVHYPGHYGPFIGFQHPDCPSISLCSCSRRAVEGYLWLRLAKPIPRNSHPERMFVLDGLSFPIDIVRELMAHGVRNDAHVIDHINFADRVCHRCNQATPTLKYCHPMYGGAFKQTFGWYVAQKTCEYGIRDWTREVALELAPRHILDAHVLDPVAAGAYAQSLYQSAPHLKRQVEKLLTKQARKVGNLVEDEVRAEFGYKKVGDGWVNETLLFRFVCDALPDVDVKRHCRPPFLDGLELDVYIPDLGVGIEYQGVQHFEPVDHWGGESALLDLTARDARKRDLCQKAGIKLLFFDCDDDLSMDLVLRRLCKVRSLRECISDHRGR